MQSPSSCPTPTRKAVARIRGPILKASARAGKRYGVPPEPTEALATALLDVADDAELDAVAPTGTTA